MIKISSKALSQIFKNDIKTQNHCPKLYFISGIVAIYYTYHYRKK